MLSYMKCCFNWKVGLGLGVLGLGMWVAAPDLVGRFLPMLIALICPLSMVAMMLGMGAMSGKRTPAVEATAEQERLTPSREDRLEQLRLEHGRIQAEMDQLDGGAG